MAKITLGVCSSVSLYKACEIIRGFQKEKFQVQVILTKNASRLISPLLFSALSGQKAIVDLFDEEYSDEIPHVDLAKETSLLLVAPATANMIGKFASGVADDFLSTFYTASNCPVLIAPSMNEAMYLHRQTQENIQKLRAMGVRFVEPEKGYLACKDIGWGRLAAPEKIVEEGLRLLKKSESLKGKTVLVTAGPTREFLDPVRFLTNRSSGKMGYELAEEALRRGAEVILISGPTHIFPPPEAKLKKVRTAQEMEKEVVAHFGQADVVIMAAAISDFRFAETSSQKIKKEKLEKKIDVVPTEDILQKLSSKKGAKIIVGFAAETEDVVNNALKKMKKKSLDLIVANNVLDEGIGFESDFNQVSLIFPDGKTIHTEKKSKLEISQIILDRVEDILGR
ncbi:MAG: bifunctional phosphopantothenoylcysteine decarboxylase/phosphopantothenate--cysteine ligase CoaBC [Candidatus Aminicenantes bacterium]|nr:MAG: bifunctional phosphopantothenoylcysteine decarboxylase/phosphopantothenate--cysteine ligase CoaBC [Candidatus Aminicenantes bacterium]